MQLPFNSSTSDINPQCRDNSVVKYDWSEVLEYTRSTFAVDLCAVPTTAPHPHDRAATLEEIALAIAHTPERHDLIATATNDDRQE